ncbi:MAG TPA: TonB-dependent receptor, partial [Sphingomicrobium sp.]|nr:TonB-dependent receptor [Sphingomicrobium sp.]
GPRFVFDTNTPTFAGDADTTTFTQIYPSKAPAYWLVNLDARFNMKFIGLKETYFQLNVYNLFDEVYVGGFGGALNQSVSAGIPPAGGAFGAPGFVQIGAPRTISGTLSLSF